MKPAVRYADLAWASAFARIEEGQHVRAADCSYCVHWKHEDPDWILLRYRAEKKLHHRMVRKGDPFLLELLRGNRMAKRISVNSMPGIRSELQRLMYTDLDHELIDELCDFALLGLQSIVPEERAARLLAGWRNGLKGDELLRYARGEHEKHDRPL